MSQPAYFGAPAHLRKPRGLAAQPDAQARCDAIQAEFRAAQARAAAQGEPQRRSIRRDPPPRPAPLAPTDDVLLGRLSEELEYARRLLEQLGDTLSADSIVIARHMVALQSVDIICQRLGHIAKVVQSADRDEAVARIGMEDLRARLLRKGGF